MEALTIGQVARLAGVGIETIRFYEREGLIAAPARSGAGYRLFTRAVVDRLRFIRRAKELLFTLTEIKYLLALYDDPAASRADVRVFADRKVHDLEHRMRAIVAARAALDRLRMSCVGDGAIDGCPILAAMGDLPEASGDTKLG